MKRQIRAALVAAFAAVASASACAQSFPAKPVHLIVPFAPGGTTDAVARVVGNKLAELLGQAVIIDNRGGGGTIIGTEALAHSPADGYTLMLATPDFTVNPGLRPKLPYDSLKDFSPVALIASYPMVLVAGADQPFNSVAELIAQAKAKPGQINYASAGIGSMPHLCAELFDHLAGVRMTHVPYKGNGPAVTDLMAGRVSILFTGGPAVAGQVKAGKLKMLAVSTATRHPSLPDLPTVAESGVAGYEVTAWFGFLAPAGVPKEVIARLNREIGKAMQAPEVREKLSSLGAELGAGTPEAFAELIRNEVDKWAAVVRTAGIKSE